VNKIHYKLGAHSQVAPIFPNSCTFIRHNNNLIEALFTEIIRKSVNCNGKKKWTIIKIFNPATMLFSLRKRTNLVGNIILKIWFWKSRSKCVVYMSIRCYKTSQQTYKQALVIIKPAFCWKHRNWLQYVLTSFSTWWQLISLFLNGRTHFVYIRALWLHNGLC
jgi:hypothetical protein